MRKCCVSYNFVSLIQIASERSSSSNVDAFLFYLFICLLLFQCVENGSSTKTKLWPISCRNKKVCIRNATLISVNSR